jgi:RNA polymerase sigma-70 factor (ECF subfamily)
MDLDANVWRGCMPQVDGISEQFERSRLRLHAVAYRMLGSHFEADDAVQEAWLRLARADAASVDNLGGWLTTVVARICLDRLRRRRFGPEQADAIDEVEPASPLHVVDPEQEALMAESVGAALLVVLELLAPAERVAFVLHDVFGVPFDEIGDVVGRTPDAARQLASRARRRVQGTSATADVDLVRQREVVSAFYNAAREGDFATLVALLDPEVELRPDATAQRLGPLRPRRGAADVAASLSKGGARGAQLAFVDGIAGLAWAPTGEIRSAAVFTVVDGKIVAIDAVGDRDHLAALEVVTI